MKSLSLNHFGYISGAIAFAVLFSVLQFSFVEAPYWDEWHLFEQQGLSRQPQFEWFFQLHNEHRIVTTKFLYWLNLIVFDLSFVVQNYFNFFLYVFSVLVLLKWLGALGGAPMGFVFPFFATALPAENHMWAFQSQFHFFILFFVLALVFSSKRNSLFWLSAPMAILSLYSFSAGVICAVFTVFNFVLMAIAEPQAWRRFLISALLVLMAVGAWFVGFQVSSGHPPLTWPWHFEFWDHYLRIVSLGFGFQEAGQAFGAGVCIFIVGGLVFGCVTNYKDPVWRLLSVFSAAIFCVLASVSASRVGLGVGQAKSSRYAEISTLLLPVVWVVFYLHLGFFLKKLKIESVWKSRVAGVGLVLLVLPLLDDFDFENEIKWHLDRRRTGLQCLIDAGVHADSKAQILQSREHPIACPTIFPAEIGSRIEVAKGLGVRMFQAASE